MDAIDRLKRLLAVATTPPNPTASPNQQEATLVEAMSAAYQACKLIQANNLTIGGETVTIPVKNWDAPNQQEMDAIISAMNQQTHGPSVDDANAPPPSGEQGTVRANVEEGVEGNAFARQCIFAWRAIRRERAQLAKEIAEFEGLGGIHRGMR